MEPPNLWVGVFEIYGKNALVFVFLSIKPLSLYGGAKDYFE